MIGLPSPPTKLWPTLVKQITGWSGVMGAFLKSGCASTLRVLP
jgi:hypothetical protein